MSPAIKAIIFDLDQTLLDTWRVHREGIYHAAERSGLAQPAESDIIASLSGSLERELNVIFNGHGRQAMAFYLEYYHRHHLEMNRPFPGVLEALKALRGNGVRAAVLSNKARRVGAIELEHADLMRHLDAAVFRDDVGVLKPDPTGLLLILDRLGVQPGEAVVAGDGPSDILCARAGGAISAATLWGALNAEALLAVGPDLVWHRIEDMLSAL